jgi:hypothetical protein
MSLLSIVLAIIVAGVLLFVVNKYVPMEAKTKAILNWVVIIVLVVWLLRAFGVFAYLKDINI